MLKRLPLKLLSSLFVAAMLMACTSSHRTDHQRSPIDLPERELSAEALLHQADLAEVRHDYITAGTHYRHYLQKFPGDPYETEVLTKLGKVYERLEDQTAALNTYRKVETEHSHSLWAAEAMLNAGRIYLRSNNIPEALTRANQVIAKENASDEQKRQGYLLRGNIYARQQTPHSALTDFLRVYELTDARLLPGLEQQIQSHVDEIDTETLTAVQQETPESAAHNWLTYLIGVRLMEQEEYQAAFEHLSAAVSADPEGPHANDARGRIEHLNPMLTPETTTIGCLLPLSGPYQAVGESALAGIELALHTLGGQHTNHRFSITVADTAGDDAKALAALERLGQKKISAIIGPIVTAKAVVQRANEMTIPLLTLNQSDGIPQIGPFIFRNFITPKMQVQALADYAVMNRGIDRLAILYPYEKYGRYYTELFRSEVQALGGQITAEVFYTTGSTDFKEPIEELLKAKPRFDALFIPDADETVGLILPQLRFYDIKNKLLLGTNLWYTDKLIEMAASYAGKAVCPADFYKESSSPQVNQFVTAMNHTYHQKPSYISAIAYDTAAILFKALITTGSNDPERIRDTLVQMAPHHGLTGKSWFEQSGEASKEITLVRIRKNKFEAVEVD